MLEIDNPQKHVYDEHDINFVTGCANVLAGREQAARTVPGQAGDAAGGQIGGGEFGTWDDVDAEFPISKSEASAPPESEDKVGS